MRKAEGGGFQQAIATPWSGQQRTVQRTWLNQEGRGEGIFCRRIGDVICGLRDDGWWREGDT